ncbi:MAG: phage baseplate assembly protein V [Oscillospiraceae bacterium]|jgi:uncharacterized protein involved in type VI secretion and phage assembly|nr:phage baseplate assembly protein V [Oscillospiraceae bacterium]
MSITDLLSKGETSLPQASGGFVLGRVAENGNKEFPGMIKVAFTAWAQGDNITKWLPVLTAYAGKEHGCYLIPEVDDIVLVGFIGPMMEQPFVLGSFFPADSPFVGEKTEENNINRALKTKGGAVLCVSDGDGGRTVRAETPKGLSLTVDDQAESISLSDKDGKNLFTLDCKNGAAELTAAQTITLKAGQCEIKLDGSGGAVTIKGGQLSLEGGQSAGLKSNGMLNLEGGTATLEGKQTVSLKGNAMCEISGGIVKIN